MNAFRPICIVLAVLCAASAPVGAADPASAEKKARPAKPAEKARPSSEAAAPTTPRRGKAADRAKSPAPAVVDINTASQAELEAHPMIGATTAAAIVAARPFSSLDDLNRLQGVSAERIEQIRLVVDAPALAAKSPAPDRAGPKHKKVDVNTADRATLEKLPSVGSDLVDALIAARPFSRIDELDRIQGISAERLEQMRTELMVATPGVAAKPDKTPKQDRTPRPAAERELSPTGRDAKKSSR